MKKETFVKICPKCGSTNIKTPPGGLNFYMSQPNYCQDCGNNGIIPEIEISKVKEFKKNLQ